MNKKLIIGLIVGAVVIGGGIYLYNKNKGKSNTGNKEMATKEDALEFSDKMGKRDEPIPTNKIEKYVELYTKNIDKETHKALISIMGKKESEINSKDKLYFAKLMDKVIKPLQSF